MNPTTLDVPDVLSGGTEKLDGLYGLVYQIDPTKVIGLNMSSVTFIAPSGLIGLLVFVRYLERLTNSPVYFFGCRGEVAAYLERVDFFQTCSAWACTLEEVLPEDTLSRSAASTNLLELACIRKGEDVRRVADRTKGILQQWLIYGSSDQNDLLLILSEMCENICEHAGDIGHVVIQRYQRHQLGYVEVRIAVGDMGQGIRNSLIRAHGEFASSPVEYIQAALNGVSARGQNILGNGFQSVRNIVQRCKGTLYVRSETGAVRVQSGQSIPLLYSDLPFMPGTQVAITLIQKRAN